MREVKAWESDAIQIMGSSDSYQALDGLNEIYSEIIDLSISDRRNGWHGVAIQAEIQYNGTSPVDGIAIKFYGSVNNVNYGQIFSFDSATLYHMLTVNNADSNIISFTVEGFPYAKIGVLQTGETDTHGIRIYSRRWKIV